MALGMLGLLFNLWLVIVAAFMRGEACRPLRDSADGEGPTLSTRDDLERATARLTEARVRAAAVTERRRRVVGVPTT